MSDVSFFHMSYVHLSVNDNCQNPQIRGYRSTRVLGQAIVEKSCRCLSSIPTSQAPKIPDPLARFMCLEPQNRRDPSVPELPGIM